MNKTVEHRAPYSALELSKETPYSMHRKLRKNQITVTDWWEYQDELQDRAAIRAVIETSAIAKKRLDHYLNTAEVKTRIRKFVNYYGYSDIRPYEVIKVHSPTRVEIRAMSVRQTVKPTLLGVGGFAGVFDNCSQEWEIYSDESNSSCLIFLSKKGWGLGKYRMSDVPVYHYDFNF